MKDVLSAVILKIINEAGEPLETKEIEERAGELEEGVTRTKVYHRLSNLHGSVIC
jgi:Fe2+ or Zn2+ uptake regulation protein